MNLRERINSLLALKALWNSPNFDKNEIYQLAEQQNNWFTRASIETAILALFDMLNEADLIAWTNHYQIEKLTPKRIGVIMAGNIPAVGFHDWLCVLLSGHILYAKLSSQDTVLIKAISSKLIEIEPRWESQIHFVERLNEVDAIIATGSDNTARYFHYYFKSKPHIIRKSRVSVAVLSGDETPEEITKLGWDVFSYYGLGCRNVSKLFVPTNFEVAKVYDYWESFAWVQENHKYKNNYDYQRAIYLVNQVKHFDNGFLIMKEETSLVSPIGVLYFEKYQNLASLSLQLEAERDKIQVVVSKAGVVPDAVVLGQAQKPNLDDYADGVDTLDFLSKV